MDDASLWWCILKSFSILGIRFPVAGRREGGQPAEYWPPFFWRTLSCATRHLTDLLKNSHDKTYRSCEWFQGKEHLEHLSHGWMFKGEVVWLELQLRIINLLAPFIKGRNFLITQFSDFHVNQKPKPYIGKFEMNHKYGEKSNQTRKNRKSKIHSPQKMKGHEPCKQKNVPTCKNAETYAKKTEKKPLFHNMAWPQPLKKQALGFSVITKNSTKTGTQKGQQLKHGMKWNERVRFDRFISQIFWYRHRQVHCPIPMLQRAAGAHRRRVCKDRLVAAQLWKSEYCKNWWCNM